MPEQENNAYKVTLSGTYRNGANESVDFQEVTGFIPLVDEDMAQAMCVKRYAKVFITQDKRYKDRVTRTRSVYVDSMEPCYHEFSYVGKDIKQMTYEELQDLATAKDLRSIPLYKAGGLREAQVAAYAAYSKAILREDIGEKEPGFKFAELPPLIVGDDVALRNTPESRTVDEIVQDEVEGKKPAGVEKVKVSREEMVKLAKDRGIQFHPAIGDEKLYKKLFG